MTKHNNLQKFDNPILISNPDRPVSPRSKENIKLTEEAIRNFLPETLLKYKDRTTAIIFELGRNYI